MDESKEIAKPGKRTTKKEVTQIKMEEEDVEDENESEDDGKSINLNTPQILARHISGVRRRIDLQT